MAGLVRDTLTPDVLIEEWGEAQQWIEDRVALAVGRAAMEEMVGTLRRLPTGFRVERVQGRPARGGDPGCELTLIDERRRPERLVGRVDRRLIGEQRVTWTARQLVDPLSAKAFAVVLRVAAVDASARSADTAGILPCNPS